MKSYLPAILMVLGGVLLLSGGNGGGVSPGPSGDDVSKAFDEYETLWRAVQVEAAKKLESGEFTKSQQVTEYRATADGQALKKSRQALLDAEFADHGGEKWTAKKAAKYLRRYAE